MFTSGRAGCPDVGRLRRSSCLSSGSRMRRPRSSRPESGSQGVRHCLACTILPGAARQPLGTGSSAAISGCCASLLSVILARSLVCSIQMCRNATGASRRKAPSTRGAANRYRRSKTCLGDSADSQAAISLAKRWMRSSSTCPVRLAIHLGSTHDLAGRSPTKSMFTSSPKGNRNEGRANAAGSRKQPPLTACDLRASTGRSPSPSLASAL